MNRALSAGGNAGLTMDQEQNSSTSRETAERERAMDYLMRTLRAEPLNNPEFPKLTEAALRALAGEVIDRNGTINHARNEHDAIASVLAERDHWAYYGAGGGFRRFADRMRRIYRRIFVVTEDVRR